MESFMQDQQRVQFIRSHSMDSSSFASASVQATPNMDTSTPRHSSHTSSYPAYYVESPSTILDLSSVDFRDHEDGRRISRSFTEPFSADSPLSRTDSFLSNYTSEPVSLMDVTARLQSWCKSRLLQIPNKWETIDEEAALGGGLWDESERSRCRDHFTSFTLWLSMTVLFTAFLLGVSTFMYWIVCHPHAPSTTLKGVEFSRFHVLQGVDRTGVPTDVVSLQSMVRLAFHNPSRHYGTFVSPATVSFSYLPRPIAQGQVPDFYQEIHSRRDVLVTANSNYVPLYGAGPSLKQAIIENRHVPIDLTISVKAHVNLFGGLVTKYFMETFACKVIFNPNTRKVFATYCEPPERLEGGNIFRIRG